MSPQTVINEDELRGVKHLEVDDIADRPAVTFLHYAGDMVDAIGAQIEDLRPMGLSTMGEWLWPVAASFDEHHGRTIVGLSYIAPKPNPDDPGAFGRQLKQALLIAARHQGQHLAEFLR